MTITRVTSSGNVVSAAISPDGRYLAYLASEEGKQSFRIRQLAGNSEVQVTDAAATNYRGLIFSPDGNSLFYLGRGNTLFTIPTLGGTPTRLLGKVYAPPTFSPDGKRMAFYRYDPQSFEHAIVVANADGSDEHNFATLHRPDMFREPVSWSPDGKTIACAVGKVGLGDTIAVIPAAGGARKTITNQSWVVVRDLKWISHGRGIIVLAMERPFSPTQLWYVSYPGGAATQVTNDLNDYAGLTLAGDSSLLATVQLERICNVAVNEAKDGNEPAPVTSSGAGLNGFYGLAWAPDGRLLYGSLAGGALSVWITSTQGGAGKPFAVRQRRRTTGNA